MMAFAACAGVLRGATATQPATSATTDQESVAEKAAAAVKALAGSSDSTVRAFAAKVAQVLQRREVALPTATAPETASSAELPEKDRILVRSACSKLPPRAFRAYAGLAYDLSIVVAEYCPDVDTRLEATLALLNPPEHNPNALRPSPSVTVRIVESILAKAFESRGGDLTRDARSVLEYLTVTGGLIFPHYFQAKAISLDPLDKKSLEKAIAMLVAQGEAAKKAVKKEDATLVAPLAAILMKVQDNTTEILDVGQSLKGAIAVAKKLFDAENAGDIATIRACYVDPTNLDVTGLKQPRPKLKFVDFRPFNFVPGNDGRIKEVHGIIQWAQTDDKGVTKMLMEEMNFVRTERGWLAGD